MARGPSMKQQGQQGQQATTHPPSERSYAGGAYSSNAYAGNGFNSNSGGYGGNSFNSNSGGYAGNGFSNAGYSYNGGGSSNNNGGGGSWLSNGGGGSSSYYTPTSDVSLFKDYSAALSALTLLGFLYFLNMLQNQLLSSGSQTVVFTVGGGSASANGTTGRKRRDVFEDEGVWSREFDFASPGDFQQHVSDTFWLYDEESEFEMGADNGAGRPESADVFRKIARPHRERKKSPSSSGSTEARDREKGDDGLLAATTSSPTTLPIREASGGPDKGERGPLEMEDAWQQLAGLLPKRLSDSLFKCRELITCTLMQQTGDQLPIHNSLHDAACADVFRIHSQSDECTEVVQTVTKTLGLPHDLHHVPDVTPRPPAL